MEVYERFIAECIVLDSNACIPAKDVQGAFRLWRREATRNTFESLNRYMKERYSIFKMNNRGIQEIHFHGLRLKPLVVTRKTWCPVETFLHDCCEFRPCGKTTIKDLVGEYKRWCSETGKATSQGEIADRLLIRNFIKGSPYILEAVIWTGSDDHSNKECHKGVYGIDLKNRGERPQRLGGAHSKPVEKCKMDTHEILDSWMSISDAAAAEGMSPVVMGRAIAKGRIINGCYYKVSNKKCALTVVDT